MSDQYTPEMAHAAVERGATWLDEHCPDWTNHIDLSTLDLGSQSACMLGQTAECLTGQNMVTRRYARVLYQFDKDTPWAEAHGFDVPIHRFKPGVCADNECNTEIVTRYEMLTLAWREYIRQRLQVPA